MRKWLFLFLLLTGVVVADEPSDDYLTGYVQAQIDRQYYDYRVRVVVCSGNAYVYNLPKDQELACSILMFVNDLPCINCVQRGDCYEEGCHVHSPCCRTCGIWFPSQTVLFKPLIADPRQVTNGAALRFNDDAIGKHVGVAQFGSDFNFYRWKNIFPWCGDLDIGIQAGIFSVFDLDHTEACMVNTDFFVALMFTYAFDKWSTRLRFWHLSSHLGDEYIISNPDVERYNLSDEGIDFFVSYQATQAIRLYAGIGDITSRDKEFPEDPLYFEFGSEIRCFGWRNRWNRLYSQPFLAMHMRTWEEHDYDLDQTYALGMEWGKVQGVGRKLRLFVEHHDGYSREGQFARKRANYTAIKMTFGY